MKAFFRKPVTIIIVILLIGVMLSIVFLQRSQNASATLDYETESARIGDITSSVEATGSVRAYQSEIYLWETSGVVGEVHVQLGEKVTKNTELASLQKASLPAEIIQAEASLLEAKRALEDLLGSSGTEAANAAIALREAQEAYDEAVNYRELLDSEVEYDVFAGSFKRLVTPFGTFKIPKINNIRYYPDDEQKAEADQDVAMQKAVLDDAQRTYDRLKDGPTSRDIEAAEARILAAQILLDQAKIFTTIDGTITNVNAQVGDQVTAGQQAFRIDDLSSLLIDLNVSEIDINSVSIGQLVNINFDAVNSKTYTGEVTKIAVASSQSADGTTGYKVTILVNDADELVKQGMTANIFIQIREAKDTLLIPNQAIRTLNGERVVYLLTGENELVAASIRLGLRAEFYSEVISGDVRPGDLVVLNPPSLINE
jgi:HlyD family secretion protein